MYVLSKNLKIVKIILLKIVILIAVKNRCILHGRVFVMVYHVVGKILKMVPTKEEPSQLITKVQSTYRLWIYST